MNAHPQITTQLGKVMFTGTLLFLLLGAATTLYGPALVYMAKETNQPVANLGILFVLHWSGFFASTLSANILGRRLGIRGAVWLGVLLVAVGELGLVALPFPSNLALAVLIGFGSGTLEVLLNRSIEFLATDAPAEALSRLHSTFGLGSVAMPLVVAGAEWLGWNWRLAGAILVALALLNAILVWRWREFSVPHAAEIMLRQFPWRSIGVFVLMVLIYIGAETAVGGWVPTFFAKLGQGEMVGAIATSLFFLTFTFGRIAFAKIPERLGYARAVRILMVLAAIALLLTFVPLLAIFGFALAGLAFSVVFPTLLAWGPRRHPQIRAQLASVTIASAAAGGVIAPYLVGLGLSAFGAWSLTPILVVTTLVVSALAFLEPSVARRSTEAAPVQTRDRIGDS
jgi:FHS family glucose/mannose:H+ symporter-like MFS transporter